MRKQKEVYTSRVEIEKVHQFFNQLSESITSGRTKVLTCQEDGIIEFLVGNERVRISTPKIRKGGLACSF